MGIARRQRREFKRAYDKAAKLNSIKPVTLKDNEGLQLLIDKLIEDYEVTTSSK